MANKAKGYIQEALTGVFVLAIILLLGYFTIVISGSNVFHPRKHVDYQVTFENVGALKLQDPVLVRGLNVGSVQEMALSGDGVMVSFRMSPEVSLREDYQITVGQTSLLGGTCLEVQPGKSTHVIASSTILTGNEPGNLVSDLNALVNDLRSSFKADDLRETIANARVISQGLVAITQRINRGEGLVGELVAPQSQLADDVRDAVANLKVASEQLTKTDNLIGKLLNEEDTAYEDLSRTLANARDISTNLLEGKGALGGLLVEDAEISQDFVATMANLRDFTDKLKSEESVVGQLLSEDSALMDDLGVTVANLRDITTQVKAGKGTIGKLVYDDAIAVETEAVIKDVRQIIDNLRDTTPVTSFTSIFFGGF